jgi:protein-L-isoaspartate(D-aspartate) O-methyltransferase
MKTKDRSDERSRMVETQIRARGVTEPTVLRAMAAVSREAFVPPEMAPFAYADEPLPIGRGQTISQPYIVAYMIEALSLTKNDRVLEVGTGSGYQTALLAEVAGEVWTIELVEDLSERARQTLEAMGYAGIHYGVGDGSRGWPEAGLFDAISVTAAADGIPAALEEQLAPEGRMIIPVGVESQRLVLVERRGKAVERSDLIGVRFVPLIRNVKDGR